ncbi:MAG: hypothetical protein HYS39_01690 [Proteobacteria bacterium]|nr:hypothetical protein [Pseudomonadota bacterium]
MKTKLIITVVILIVLGWLWQNQFYNVSKILPPLTFSYSTENEELVAFQSKLEPGHFYGPCPILPHVEEDLIKRLSPIIFDQPSSTQRSWEMILQERFYSNFQELTQTLKEFLKTYYKLQVEGSSYLFGLSGSGDLLNYTRHAICDELVFIHHHIEGGIHPDLDFVSENTSKIKIQDKERKALEAVYRSCKMTASNAHRYAITLTRVHYSPSQEDEKLINHIFDIDPKRPNEIICTYRDKTTK